jgi:hypothetical protein
MLAKQPLVPSKQPLTLAKQPLVPYKQPLVFSIQPLMPWLHRPRGLAPLSKVVVHRRMSVATAFLLASTVHVVPMRVPCSLKSFSVTGARIPELYGSCH